MGHTHLDAVNILCHLTICLCNTIYGNSFFFISFRDSTNYWLLPNKAITAKSTCWYDFFHFYHLDSSFLNKEKRQMTNAIFCHFLSFCDPIGQGYLRWRLYFSWSPWRPHCFQFRKGGTILSRRDRRFVSQNRCLVALDLFTCHLM